MKKVRKKTRSYISFRAVKDTKLARRLYPNAESFKGYLCEIIEEDDQNAAIAMGAADVKLMKEFRKFKETGIEEL